MPSITFTDPLALIGVFFVFLGIFLFLAGLNIIEIGKIIIKPGARTCIIGLLVLILGFVFLRPYLISYFSPVSPPSPTPTIEAATQAMFTPPIPPATAISVAATTAVPVNTQQPATQIPPSTAIVKYPPIIAGIKLLKSPTASGVIIYADISFQDLDGDAYNVTYNVLNTTAKGIKVENDPITSPANDQILGTSVRVKWACEAGGYVVTLNAIIQDKAGNESNPYPLVFDCR